MSPKAEGGFVKVPRDFPKTSLDFRGDLITNFPNVMVLLINFSAVKKNIYLQNVFLNLHIHYLKVKKGSNAKK